MPPQIPNQMISEPEQKCPWYQPLCKVTPLSKYLAMVIFIALPFVGEYIGYRIAPEKVVEVPVVMLSNTTTPKIPVPAENNVLVQDNNSSSSNEIINTATTTDVMSGYKVGKKYGDFTIIDDKTAPADGYSFPTAHNFTFVGTTTVKGMIVLDDMLSPFLEIVNASTTGLPSIVNGFAVVPNFINYYSTVFTTVNQFDTVYKEAKLHPEWDYFINFDVTELQIQVGAPKISSISVEKIAPLSFKVSTTTKVQ
jgi:hypothetical protein